MEEKKTVHKEMTEREALQKLGALCSRAEHCTHDLTEKMRRWGMSQEAQQSVMAQLLKARFVDDERYARAFVSDKMKYSKWGRRKVEQALYIKGISEDIRHRVLEEADYSDYLSTLRSLLQAKRRSVKAASPYELRCKLIRFAMGRGFDMQTIQDCLEDLPESDD